MNEAREDAEVRVARQQPEERSQENKEQGRDCREVEASSSVFTSEKRPTLKPVNAPQSGQYPHSDHFLSPIIYHLFQDVGFNVVTVFGEPNCSLKAERQPEVHGSDHRGTAPHEFRIYACPRYLPRGSGQQSGLCFCLLRSI